MRVIIIVLDSFGIGALPDAARFHDEGSNTLGHIYQHTALNLSNMAALGLYNIDGVDIPHKTLAPIGIYGKAAEQSAGKDTTCGHWEIMGLVSDNPFPVYPDGFPKEIINRLETAWGKKIIGNRPASGTQIIQQLGQDHVSTGNPIVYTSADSVLQIAAHESVIPLQQLYQMCEQARVIMTGKNGVGRVIARPFTGENGNYLRTANRRDFSLKPDRTLLNDFAASGFHTIGIGKISDIFAGSGLTESHPTHGNEEGIEKINELIQNSFNGLLFANLVDFDMLYGHRNDIEGYAKALERFDKSLEGILNALKNDDLLLITADHGCDPVTEGTDHTREYIPILAYGKNIAPKNIGTRNTFGDIAASAAQYLGVKYTLEGTSFLTKEG